MKKKRVAWVTDSTAFLTEDLKNHPDVFTLPIGIIFEDGAYDDGIDLTTDQLYEHIRSNKEVPKTSQPSAGRFAQLYETLKEDYDQAIAIHISSKLSGTLDSSTSGAKMAEFDVKVVDSLSMSYAITTLLEKGMEKEKEGNSAEEIAKYLSSEAEKSENFILLGSLEQFYKGGRMTGAQYLLGNLLQIKPVIRINKTGEFELFQKIRSEKKAVNRLIELLKESYDTYVIKQVNIMHGNVMEEAQELKTRLNEQMPDLKVFIGDISSSIAVHAGEGTLALVWHNEYKK